MTRTVSSILAEKHNISLRPGAKGRCPFCQHDTFSIKRDDTLGKCFHPSCGRYVTPGQFEGGLGGTLHRALEIIQRDFHAELMRLRGVDSRNAYAYCVQERGIHPRVVADSLLGAVPSGYDVEQVFAPLIAEIEATVQSEPKRGPGRPAKAKANGPAERVAFLKKAQEKLAMCLRGHAGYLAFFYTDGSHRFTSVRFREPYAKNIVYFKPGKIGGAFGHGLFTPYVSEEMRPLNDYLTVVEGEFNQLQLQSLCAREAELRGRPPETGYVYACAVGGVHNTDVGTLKRLARSPMVCYDHDANEAGFALVTKLLAALTVTAFTTPKPDSDLDDFIRGFGLDTAGAHKAVQALVAGRHLHVRPYDALRNEIDDLRNRVGAGKEPLKYYQLQRGAAEIVIGDLTERGRILQDGANAYVFLEGEKRLVAIDRGCPFFQWILSRYGIGPSEDLFQFVLNALGIHALEHGTRTEVYAFSHYDRDRHALYIFNFENQVYRIRPEGVELVDNGTDGVLFLHNPRFRPFIIGAPPEHSPFNEDIVNTVHFRTDGLSVEQRRVVFTMWFYALFFPELFPTKPIAALIGEKGSGKTFALRKVGQLLFGPDFNVMQLSEDPKDFDAAVTSESFVAVDNADSPIKWLADRLAVVATGGKIMRRRLYTTNELVAYQVRAFLSITSRTPHFRREDVAERLLLFPLERLESFQPESHILAQLQRQRDVILTEVVGNLHEMVKALHEQRGATFTTRFRMADFADFCLKVATAQGWQEQMRAILERLTGEQASFATEAEPIFELLEMWLEADGGRNVGREVRSTELHQEIVALADAKKLPFKYRSAVAFGRRLRGLMSTLREFFEVEEHAGKARAWHLAFRPKDERDEKEAA